MRAWTCAGELERRAAPIQGGARMLRRRARALFMQCCRPQRFTARARPACWLRAASYLPVLVLNCCHPFPLVRGTERRIFGVARCLPQAAQGAGSALADVRFSSCAGWQAGRCIGIAVQLLERF